ncbi:MAG: phosphatidylserine decarboxylase [bacterium]
MNTILIIISTIIILFAGMYIWWRFYYFFRDPERKIPAGDNIVSPADGTIVYVKEINEGQIPMSVKKGKEIRLEEIANIQHNRFNKGYIIGIFMSPLSVHINRAPISGKVEQISYFHSKNINMGRMFLNTIFRIRPFYSGCDHLLQNERNTIIIDGKFPIAVVQIADVVVHKILCWVKEGQTVTKGERIGLIRMGSQVDIILPAEKGIKIAVKEGEYVYAGQTVLVTY